MSEDNHWLRNYVVAPLVVAIIAAVFTYYLTSRGKEKAELSYRIDTPSEFLSQRIQGLRVVLGTNAVSFPVLYRVTVWNSGDVTIKDIPVSLVFRERDSAFSILVVQHQTVPAFEFGPIRDTTAEAIPSGFQARRFVYSQLDPRDLDHISILTDGRGELAIYAKGRGTHVSVVNQTNRRPSIILFAVVAMLLSIAATLLPKAARLVPVWKPQFRVIRVIDTEELERKEPPRSQ
ncbi:hypothetical protein [Longimicrobium sp.]|uniref:hypothetical protein n=1 Tax=Longimicrobium sp. TaxID=2029185 RepID=UPI002BBC388D|nr:hypothetical protein [Longimicrobium sp.]HSU17344.1 hypothetical protein [Longimicrobium sp.]